jgi:hypothetical protein
MMIGPAPMIRIDLMSVRLGISGSFRPARGNKAARGKAFSSVEVAAY